MNIATSHRVTSVFETVFQRDYQSEAPSLRRLYENAKRDQWNASSDIVWSTEVDLEEGIFADELVDCFGSDYWTRLDRKTQAALNVEFSAWRISQLLHGEEGAMLVCSQLVDMVSGNDAKYFQATQVVDEARHAEVLSRYLLEKAGGRIYPVTPNVRQIFDYLLDNRRWFIKTVGLQLIAETFAVSLFRMIAQTAKDLLLREICKRILSDESRHMGFSVLSLPDEIAGLNAADMRELEEFTHEALTLVLTGQFPKEAYEAIGFSAAEVDGVRRVRKERARSGEQALFRRLFRREMNAQVVTNMARVGLLNERTSNYLRELGIDPADTGYHAA